MTAPITPEEARTAKAERLPPTVFEVFNRLIVEGWVGRGATIRQSDALTAVANALGISETEVYARHLLDVEGAYRAAGWDVEYDKPGFNETYPATFRFTSGNRP